MLRHTAVLCTLLLFTSVGLAQGDKDDVVSDLAVEDLEKILKGAWKRDKLEKKEFRGSYRYFFNKEEWIDFYHGKDDGRKFILVQMSWPFDRFNNKVTLEQINDWNIAAVYSRAYFYKANKQYAGVTLEGTLPLDGGVSNKQLAAFVTQLDKEFQRFAPAVGGLKNAPQPKPQPDTSSPRNRTSAPLDVALVQQEIAADVPVENIEKSIKQALKIDNLKKQEGKHLVRFQIDDALSIDYYHGKFDGRKFILIQYNWPRSAFQQEVTLEKLNDWNIDAVYTRCYFFRGKDKSYAGVTLEATLMLDAGIGPKQLDTVMKQYDKEFTRFLPFVGGLKAKQGTSREPAPRELASALEHRRPTTFVIDARRTQR